MMKRWENEYKLSNYNFDSTATICDYKAIYQAASTLFTIKVNGDSAIFYWGNNNFKGKDYRYSSSGPSASGNAYTTFFKVDDDPDFINTFISDLKENGKCPQLSNVVLGEYDTSDMRTIVNYKNYGQPVTLVGEKIGSNVDIPTTNMECDYFYDDTVFGKNFHLTFKTYLDTKEEWCISYYPEKSSELAQICTDFDDIIRIPTNRGYTYIFSVDDSMVEKIKNSNGKCFDKSEIFIKEKDVWNYIINTSEGKNPEGNDPLEVLSGEIFKEKIEELRPYFEELVKQKNITINDEAKTKLNLSINGIIYPYSWDGIIKSKELTDQEKADAEDKTIEIIYDTVNYCNKYIYERYVVGADTDATMKKRLDECDSFKEMVKEAEELGLLRNISSECGMLSSDFTKILKDILNLVKIAGPILALGLGTLDFIKAMVSGDAEKEMKSAWKRFITRIIAAILLFLIPIILAFLLDRFLGVTPGNGYNPDNPFCIDTGISEQWKYMR